MRNFREEIENRLKSSVNAVLKTDSADNMCTCTLVCNLLVGSVKDTLKNGAVIEAQICGLQMKVAIDGAEVELETVLTDHVFSFDAQDQQIAKKETLKRGGNLEVSANPNASANLEHVVETERKVPHVFRETRISYTANSPDHQWYISAANETEENYLQGKAKLFLADLVKRDNIVTINPSIHVPWTDVNVDIKYTHPISSLGLRVINILYKNGFSKNLDKWSVLDE